MSKQELKGKTYRQIINELDEMLDNDDLNKSEKDELRNQRNDILMELTIRAYGYSLIQIFAPLYEGFFLPINRGYKSGIIKRVLV